MVFCWAPANLAQAHTNNFDIGLTFQTHLTNWTRIESLQQLFNRPNGPEATYVTLFVLLIGQTHQKPNPLPTHRQSHKLRQKKKKKICVIMPLDFDNVFNI